MYTNVSKYVQTEIHTYTHIHVHLHWHAYKIEIQCNSADTDFCWATEAAADHAALDLRPT